MSEFDYFDDEIYYYSDIVREDRLTVTLSQYKEMILGMMVEVEGIMVGIEDGPFNLVPDAED